MTSKLGVGLTKKATLYYADPKQLVRRPGWNPRFDFGDMEELMASIKAQGVIQALWVRRNEAGKLEVVDGDRRFTAVERLIEAGCAIPEVPVRLLDKAVPDGEALILAMTTNLGKPLLPLEEAGAYKRLCEELKLTPAELAKKLGRSEAHVKDRISLVEAAPAVKEGVASGALGVTLAENIVQSAQGDLQKQTDLAATAMSGKDGKRQVQNEVGGKTRTRVKPSGDALYDLELGQLADLAVITKETQMVASNNGRLTEDDIVHLTQETIANPKHEVFFRLGALMAFRAAQGKKHNLLKE